MPAFSYNIYVIFIIRHFYRFLPANAGVLLLKSVPQTGCQTESRCTDIHVISIYIGTE